MRLKNFCIPFQWSPLLHLKYDWQKEMGEDFDLMSGFLLPTNNLATTHPGIADSYWQELKVRMKPDGRVFGVHVNSRKRFELTKEDIIYYKFDLRRFRREMCEGFGLVPQSGEIDLYDRDIPWAMLEPEKGARFPVSLFLGWHGRLFSDRLAEVALNRKAEGEIIITANRRYWKEEALDIAQKHNLLLVPLDEIIQMENGKFLPTPEWDEYLTAFCKMVECDLPSRFQKKTPEFMLAKRGSWIFRFGHNETVTDGHAPGPAFVQFLLQNPGVEFHVEQLWQAVMGTPVRSGSAHIERAFVDDDTSMPDGLIGGADEVVDVEAKKSYEKRLKELAVERITAENDKDFGELDRINEEFEFIRKTLEGGGSSRHLAKKLGDPVVQLRDRIRRGINSFIEQVSGQDSAGGQYLKNTIKKGKFMEYVPSQTLDWVFF